MIAECPHSNTDASLDVLVEEDSYSISKTRYFTASAAFAVNVNDRTAAAVAERIMSRTYEADLIVYFFGGEKGGFGAL